MKYEAHFNVRETPQSEKIPGSTQVLNSAGGYSWAVDSWTRLDRFLILGNEGGSYYASERKLTIENATAVQECLKQDGPRVVQRVLEISEAGRAPKNDPAIFVLAMAAGLGDQATKNAAYLALSRVCRIGTHIFHFAQAVQAFRGWGRGLRSAVGSWYNGKEAKDLAYQLIKYRQRDGWTHADVLRLSHPRPKTEQHDSLFKWAVDGTLKEGQAISLIEAFDELQRTTDAKAAAYMIRQYNMPREAVPTDLLKSVDVWSALLEKMPYTAMIRNLATMTNVGLLKPLSSDTTTVTERLLNQEGLTRARVHPIAILAALKTYESGRGVRGSQTWTPVPEIVEALDEAFYLAFGNVQPTGKRLMLALDVSASMDGGAVAGVHGLTPRMASSAMALVTARVEPQYVIVAFTTTMISMTITKRSRLDDVMKVTSCLPFGGTDCAQPMLYAMQQKLQVDGYSIYTDNETWTGRVHPAQALQQYRQMSGLPAKLVVVGMVSNQFSIANPDDSGMLDCVGFDTSTPQVVSDFLSV